MRYVSQGVSKEKSGCSSSIVRVLITRPTLDIKYIQLMKKLKGD